MDVNERFKNCIPDRFLPAPLESRKLYAAYVAAFSGAFRVYFKIFRVLQISRGIIP